MTGLILKDLYALRKQGKSILVMAIFYLIFGIATANTSMFGAIVVLMATMLPITTMSYDEYFKWDRYALSMPVSRTALVLSKYVLSLILSLSAGLITLGAGILIMKFSGELDLKLLLYSTLGYVVVSSLFTSLVFPIIFKFGVEKGRLLMILAFAIPALGIMLLARVVDLPDIEEILYLSAYLVPLMAIVGMVLSLSLSMAIYRRKEF